MKSKLLFFVALLCLSIQLMAQPKGEKIVFPSPQAAQLGKYGGYSINHSSGSPNVSIPVYTAVEGGLEIPISLTYQYTGLKPSDLPGWCGVGWSLVTGGVVSRVIKGRRDEIGSQGYLGNGNAIKDMVVNGVTNTAYQNLNIIDNLYDNHPDIFSFQFMGYSGKFVFNEAGVPQVISDQKIKITYVKGTETVYNDLSSILSWTIITENGNKYTFGRYELSATGDSGNTWDTTSWHLTEILTSKGDRVTFEYVAIDTSKKRVQLGRADKLIIATSSAAMSSATTVNLTSNESHEIYLQKIKGSLWEVNFNSSPYTKTVSTSQVTNGRKLDNIQVVSLFPTSATIKQFSFTYNSALQLLTVGEDGKPAHQLAYYGTMPTSLDGYTTSMDYWGYYNGQTNTSLIPGDYTNDLEPREELTKIGALQQITYPTGGRTTFEYEQNEYSYAKANVISKSKIVVENYTYSWYRSSQGLTTGANPPFTLTNSTRVDVVVNVPPGGLFSECNNLAGDAFSLTLPAGTYTGEALLNNNAFYPCNGRYNQVGFNVGLSVKVFRETTSSTSSYGGIRVTNITDYPSATTSPITRTYSYKDASNASLSSGMVAQEPTYMVDISGISGYPYPFRIYASTPFNPISVGGHYYKDVKETFADYVTEHSFTSHINYVDTPGKYAFLNWKNTISGDIKVSEIPYREIGTFQSQDFMRTLPQKITTKDLAGNLKQEITYNYANSGRPFVAALHHEYLSTFITYQTFNPMEVIWRMFYTKAVYIQLGWPQKISEVTKNYGNGGINPVTTTTTYGYSPNHLQLISERVEQSDGNALETEYKYPADYANPADTYITAMTTANMHANPLEKITWLVKSVLDWRVVNAELTTYGSFTGNSFKPTLLLPAKKYRFNGFNGALGTNGFVAYNGNEAALNAASYFEAVRFTNYDTGGNPLSIRFNQLDNISYLWAYKGQHPVAEIKNADYTQVNTALSAAGTSFSALSGLTDSPTVKSKLDAVRVSLTGAQMNSYLYTPLVGITTAIDPAGKNLVYEYDALERLKNIKNPNGTIRESFCYNYAGQPIDCIGVNISGFSPPATLALLGDPAAPPVPSSFLNFVGIKEEETALLNWNTEHDTSSERFDVERSNNGKEWTRIGSLEAETNADGRQFYSFKDESPIVGGENQGRNKYRLRIANTDGSYTFSRMEELQFMRGSAVYPNPLRLGDQLHLESHDKIAQVKIYDINGRAVLSVKAPEGTIDVNKLLPGTYVVQITGTNGSVSVHSVVKQ